MNLNSELKKEKTLKNSSLTMYGLRKTKQAVLTGKGFKTGMLK